MNRIVAVNEFNEPYNSNDILNTPLLVNINEEVYFYYHSEYNNVKYIWDFDYTYDVPDNNIQELYDNLQIPVTFYRNGDRFINVKVYDKFEIPRIDTINTISNIWYSNNVLYYNDNTNKYYISTNNNIILYDIDSNTYSILHLLSTTITTVTINNTLYTLSTNLLNVIDENDIRTNFYTLSYNAIDMITDGEFLYISDTGGLIHKITTSNVLVSFKYIPDAIIKLFYNNNKIYAFTSNECIIYDTDLNLLSNIPLLTLQNPTIISYNDDIIIKDDITLTVLRNDIIIFSEAISNNTLLVNDNEKVYFVEDFSFYSTHYSQTIYSSKLGILNLNDMTISYKEFDINLDNLIGYNINSLYFYNNNLITTIAKTNYTNNTVINSLEIFKSEISVYSENINNTNIVYYNNVLFDLRESTIFNKQLNIRNYSGNYDYLKLIDENTINFNVFKFPTKIIGLEYAVEEQTLTYTLDSIGAESYVWSINNEVLSYTDELVFDFTNIVKADVKCVIRNGYKTLTLTFTTTLSLGNTVIGQYYDNNVKDNLLFFNKEGDNLNFEYIDDVQPYWSGDMIFHHNSNDTFKTIALYTLEKVNPFKFQSENLYTRKVQLFNEYGIEFQSSKSDFLIENIISVNNDNNYYTKYIISYNIHNHIKIGDEILLTDIYSIDDYEKIPDFDNNKLYTVVGLKQNTIIVITNTNNQSYNSNYGYGEYRQTNNTIKHIPQGKVITENIIKIVDVDNSNTEWNEPNFLSLIYEKKKISIINSKNNDKVITVKDNDFSHKLFKIDYVSYLNDISVTIKSKVSKQLISSTPIDFLPSTTINNKNILIWNSILNKDYTPNILTKNSVFSFESNTHTNFDSLYKVLNINIASNILEYNSSYMDGYKLTILNHDTQTIKIKIDNTLYTLIESIHYNKGLTISDLVSSLFLYLQGIGLSVVKDGNDILFINVELIETDDYIITNNVLNVNNPYYGIINNKWIIINNDYNGYIHFRNNIYYVYYNETWYPLSANKKIVVVEPTFSIEYLINCISDAYLEQESITFSQESAEKFIISYYNTLKYYGLEVYIEDDKLMFEHLYCVESLDDKDSYIDVDILNKETMYKIVDMFSIQENLIDEIDYKQCNNFRREIVIDDIDNVYGLNLIINNIEFPVRYDNNIQNTLTDWGNQRFSIEQDITPDDRSDIGKPYHRILEELGIIVSLDKHFSTDFNALVIESKFPNVNVRYDIIGTNNSHKILHSKIEFIEIYNNLTITINNTAYTTSFENSIENTLIKWVNTYKDSLILSDIVVSYYDNNIEFSTLEENTRLNYKIWVGISPTPDLELYNIYDYRKGYNGIILSGNEIRNNSIDFQTVGFATGMVSSLNNSVYPLNNQDYNILFVDPNILTLSYQGAFWNNNFESDIFNRTNFRWDIFDDYRYLSDMVFSDDSTDTYLTYNIIDILYENMNQRMWIMTSNVIYIDNITISLLNVPYSIKQCPDTHNVYVIFNTSNRVDVYDIDGIFLYSITTGNRPIDIIFNTFVYIINSHSNNITVVDNGNVIDTLDTLTLPRSVDYDNNKIYLVGSYDLEIMDLTNNSRNTFNLGYSNSRKVQYYKNKVYTWTGFNIRYFDGILKTVSLLDNINDMLIVNDKMYIAYNFNTYIYDINNFSIIKSFNFTGSLYYSEITKQVMVNSINRIICINVDDMLDSDLTTTFNTSKISYSYDNMYVYYGNKYITFSIDENDIIDEKILSLNVREFLRYPRERFDGNYPVKFRFSWDDNDESIFFYDFSGEQLYITDNNGKRIIDKKDFNYTGNIPLLKDNSVRLQKHYNLEKEFVNEPTKQQTVFNELYYDIKLIDSENDININPIPMQTFIGYNSKNEGVNSRLLKIDRLENIKLNLKTDYKNVNYPDEGYKNIIEFKDNVLTLKNADINLIDIGFRKGQKILIYGYDYVNMNNQKEFINSGLECIIDNVFINKMILISLNKNIVDEVSVNMVSSQIPPYNAIISMFNITIETLPEPIARINIKGQTEIEDERYKVLLNNIGYNINYSDIFIFDNYDINEHGIDWCYLNDKRKEMLLVYPEIYNYLGSYKAVINAIKYFGYEDLQFFEYYLNTETNKYNKIEIPNIFSNLDENYKENDYIKKTLPNKKYHKTNLFNLTYRITDYEGNYLLAYSPDEIITKLLGLKKWVRENVMPIGTNLKDITGVGETLSDINIWNNMKMCRKFNINETLTIINFDCEAYLIPVVNETQLYNINIKFFANSEDNLPDYFQLNVYTFKDDNFDNLNAIQKHSFYKTDMKDKNITASAVIDPYILIETIQYNDYGATYKKQRVFSLSNLSFI